MLGVLRKFGYDSRPRSKVGRVKKRRGFSKSELRLSKDLEDISEGKFITEGMQIRLSFPNGNSSPSTFLCKIIIHAGCYANTQIEFVFNIPADYPFIPPIVHCITPTYHPNIDNETGRVGLMCIYEDWTSTLTLNHVILGLQQLLLIEPNLDNRVLNPEAAQNWRTNPEEFRRIARKFHEKGKNRASSSSFENNKKRCHSSGVNDDAECDGMPAFKKFRCENGSMDAKDVFEESKTMDLGFDHRSFSRDEDTPMTGPMEFPPVHTGTHVSAPNQNNFASPFNRNRKRRLGYDSSVSAKRRMTSFKFEDESPMNPRNNDWSFPRTDDGGDVVMESV